MAKRGRPAFESDEDNFAAYKAVKTVYPELTTKRSFQNKCFELRAIQAIAEEKRDIFKVLWNDKPDDRLTYKPPSSLLTELGRFENKELIIAIAEQLCNEMGELPNKPIAEWRRDLRQYRLNLIKGI
ncbi:MAG TPA: hypothetical protein PKJ95_00285 [Atribacterota bacterium]|nr:hypothetical protein [Atribacterota bacterium]